MSVRLVNPNGSHAVTAQMVGIAARVLPGVVGQTLSDMPPMLVTARELDLAAERVAALRFGPEVEGVIVAAFGDPGAGALAARLDVPVIGIGAAAARAACTFGARFAVATTTPELKDRIDALMRGAGGDYVGSFFAASADPAALIRDRAALDAGLLDAVTDAAAAGAERVIIGGGPLAEAGLRLADRSPVPLIHPLIAAAEEMAAAIEAAA